MRTYLLDLLASQHSVHKLERRHVRPAPRAVDGEKTQAGDGHVVEVGVGMADQLTHLLSGRVRADLGYCDPILGQIWRTYESTI